MFIAGGFDFKVIQPLKESWGGGEGHRALAPLDSCPEVYWYASDINIITATVEFCH